jgi:hypothetical protein
VADRPAPSTKPIAQKLLVKAGYRTLVLNAPAGYLANFPPDLRVEQRLTDEGDAFDFIQVFETQRVELVALAPRLRAALKPKGLAWVSYPKGKAVPTDLNRDIVRTSLAPLGLETVTQVAIDDVWSALRVKRS